MGSYAQKIAVVDTIKPLHISPDLKKMIRFSGYMQPRSAGLGNSSLLKIDSLKFNGIQTIQQLTIGQFMKMTQAEEDKYRKQMEAIYKPLREEQQRIIESGVGKGTFNYDATLGYPNPFTMPTELLNVNTHQEDKLKETESKNADILKKYEQLKEKK